MAMQFKIWRVNIISLLAIICGLILINFSSAAEAVKETAPQPKTALILTIKGAIAPAMQDYIQRGLEAAQKEHAAVIILQMDTPGGLDTSMREIIRSILASPIPVIGYVAPSGARAASAGTYILYATQIAAMAPGTNVGAATPINFGGDTTDKDKSKKIPSDEERKVANDARAYLRSLAQLRDRNVPWTEQAISQSASLSASEALKLKVIDIIAPDINSLLTQINGKVVMVQGEKITLQTAGLIIVEKPQDWRTQFLAVITNPNVAYILLLIGIYGLFFEFFNPGFVLPGVAGVIALLLALYALQLLPVYYAGLALIICGIAFLVSEAFFPSGVLGVGGVLAFFFGSLMLFNREIPGFGVALSVIIAVSLVTAVFFLLVINVAIRARFRPIVSGREELMNSEGEIVLVEEKPLLRLRGELWQVKSKDPLLAGEKVIVIDREGLVLIVKTKS